MDRLIDKSSDQLIACPVRRAAGFLERAAGLMGKRDLPEKSALWLCPCPSVHTFFMKFPLDVIFADRGLQVVSVFHSAPPGKLLFGGWKSHSAFEMRGGRLKSLKLKKGDQLYVGP